MDSPLVIVLITVAVFVPVGVGVWKFYGWLRRSAEKAQRRLFEGCRIEGQPGEGLVGVTFHTYYGFLAFVTQTEYRFWASPEDAREILGRLQGFNLRWGWLAVGSILHLPLSCLSYLAQTRSIARQAREIGNPGSGIADG